MDRKKTLSRVTGEGLMHLFSDSMAAGLTCFGKNQTSSRLVLNGVPWKQVLNGELHAEGL